MGRHRATRDRPRGRRVATLVVLGSLGVLAADTVLLGVPHQPPPRASGPLGAPATVEEGERPVAARTTTESGAAPPSEVEAPFTTAAPDERARIAVRAALSQIGLPYVWGGDGPAAGDAGFDCSGLTHYAYGVAGVDLPRTAHTQYLAGPHLRDTVPLEPGDLVFYGVPSRVHHVGMYIGRGRMVNAPTFGQPVQIAYYRWPGDDYLGATRPTAGATEPGTVLVAPEPPAPAPGPNVFEAPAAPAEPGELEAAGTTVDPAVPVTDPTAVDPAPTGPTDPGTAALAAPQTVEEAPSAGAPAATDPASAAPQVTPSAPTAARPGTATPPGTSPGTAVPPRTVPPTTTTTTPPAPTTPPTTPPAATTPQAPTTSSPTPPTLPGPTGPLVLQLPTGAPITIPATGWTPAARGGALVRLASAEPLAGLAAGDRVTARFPDGRRLVVVVRSVRTGTAAPVPGALVLTGPGADGAAVVVVAT